MRSACLLLLVVAFVAPLEAAPPTCTSTGKASPFTYQCRKWGKDVCDCPTDMSCRPIVGYGLRIGTQDNTYCVPNTCGALTRVGTKTYCRINNQDVCSCPDGGSCEGSRGNGWCSASASMNKGQWNYEGDTEVDQTQDQDEASCVASCLATPTCDVAIFDQPPIFQGCWHITLLAGNVYCDSGSIGFPGFYDFVKSSKLPAGVTNCPIV